MLQEPWPEDDSEDRWLSQVGDYYENQHDDNHNYIDDHYENHDEVSDCDNSEGWAR